MDKAQQKIWLGHIGEGGLETYTAAKCLVLKFLIEMMKNLSGKPLFCSKAFVCPVSPCGLCTLPLPGHYWRWIIPLFQNKWVAQTRRSPKTNRETGTKEVRGSLIHADRLWVIFQLSVCVHQGPFHRQVRTHWKMCNTNRNTTQLSITALYYY